MLRLVLCGPFRQRNLGRYIRSLGTEEEADRAEPVEEAIQECVSVTLRCHLGYFEIGNSNVP